MSSSSWNNNERPASFVMGLAEEVSYFCKDMTWEDVLRLAKDKKKEETDEAQKREEKHLNKLKSMSTDDFPF